MTKFNVGDKVRFIEKFGEYSKGDEVTIKSVIATDHVKFEGEHGVGDVYTRRLELVKTSKNQRITALENEVAELKLIVHELRGKKSIEPSTTNTVEDIIEFEGQQYRKVDRKAHEGDVIIIREPAKDNSYARINVPHKVVLDELNKPCINNPEDAYVYCDYFGRTHKTVDVYERIDNVGKSPNQQRAAIIEKAKKLVEENLKLLISYDFVVNNNGLKLYSRQRYQDIQLTTAKCSSNDVFNEHIGKAIALGRALGLDVSEFEQAVQPTVAIGQIISNKYWKYEVLTLKNNSKNLKLIDNGTFADGGDLPNRNWYTIVDDTNAKYEGDQ